MNTNPGGHSGVIAMIYNIIKLYYSDYDKHNGNGKLIGYEEVADSGTVERFYDKDTGSTARTIFLTRIYRDFEVISNDFEKREIKLISHTDAAINSIKNDIKGFYKFLDVTEDFTDFYYYYSDCHAIYQSSIYMGSFEQVNDNIFNFKVDLLRAVKLTFKNINVLSSTQMDEVVTKVKLKKNELGI